MNIRARRHPIEVIPEFGIRKRASSKLKITTNSATLPLCLV
jgi:hypothetical protein